jgi:hypothetical protein
MMGTPPQYSSDDWEKDLKVKEVEFDASTMDSGA